MLLPVGLHQRERRLVLPLLVEYGRQHNWWNQRQRSTIQWRPLAAITLAVPAGFAVYAYYCWRKFGDPWLLIHGERHDFQHAALTLGQSLGVIAQAVHTASAGTYLQARLLVDVVPILLALVLLGAALWHRSNWPASYALYVALLLYLCIAFPVQGTEFPDPVISAGRYLLAAFPCSLLLGRWMARSHAADLAVVILGLLSQAVLLGFYLHGGWIV